MKTAFLTIFLISIFAGLNLRAASVLETITKVDRENRYVSDIASMSDAEIAALHEYWNCHIALIFTGDSQTPGFHLMLFEVEKRRLSYLARYENDRPIDEAIDSVARSWALLRLRRYSPEEDKIHEIRRRVENEIGLAIRNRIRKLNPDSK